MAFPPGTPVVTLTGLLPSAVAGTGYNGKITLTPSAILTDDVNNAIYFGGGSVPIINGTFTMQLLPINAPGITPAGWRWYVEVETLRGEPLEPFWAEIAGDDGDVIQLADLVPVQAPGGGNATSLVSSVNGEQGVVVLSAADVGADPAGAAAAAQTVAATDATNKVSTHASDTTDVHGIPDTAQLVMTGDARLSNSRTPTAHAASHAAAGSDPVTLTMAQITGLANALAALLPLAGGDLTGELTINILSGGASAPAIGGGINNETFDRWRIRADGTIEWGPGGIVARDTTLRRSGVNELTASGSLIVTSALRHLGTTAGFYGATATTKPSVTGSRGGNAALGSLVSALATLGLITDNTTA
ncbi:hypothetical protein ACFQ67_00190 [Streptomyces sp. NPDC056488]|uniref:hypothetical protein n=1 Tax=Streptomyces sp. NPDC056488 TaxID=3345836 RepID=UPI00368715C6